MKDLKKDHGDLISGYRSLVEQIRRLILIIGDKDLKKCFFIIQMV